MLVDRCRGARACLRETSAHWWGAYQILAPIGAGGMGEHWRLIPIRGGRSLSRARHRRVGDLSRDIEHSLRGRPLDPACAIRSRASCRRRRGRRAETRLRRSSFVRIPLGGPARGCNESRPIDWCRHLEDGTSALLIEGQQGARVDRPSVSPDDRWVAFRRVVDTKGHGNVPLSPSAR